MKNTLKNPFNYLFNRDRYIIDQFLSEKYDGNYYDWELDKADLVVRVINTHPNFEDYAIILDVDFFNKTLWGGNDPDPCEVEDLGIWNICELEYAEDEWESWDIMEVFHDRKSKILLEKFG